MATGNSIIEKLAGELQSRIGILPKVETHSFSLACHPDQNVEVLKVQPSSLPEIVRVVRAARSLKLCVRCCGSSTSNEHALFVDNCSVLIDMRGLCDRTKIEIVHQRRGDFTREMGVRVLAGVTVLELADFEVQNQVNLASNVESTARTVVGSVVSGSHATAIHHGSSLADQVMQIQIIDCNGDLRTYSDDGGPGAGKALKTIVANLGLMGIVYDVTLRVLPIMNVEINHKFIPIKDLCSNYDLIRSTATDNYSVQLVYIPFNSAEADSYGCYDLEMWYPENDLIMLRTTQLTADGVATNERQFVPLVGEPGPPYDFLEKPEETVKAMKATFDMQRRQFLEPSVQQLPWAIHCFETINAPTFDLSFTVNIGEDSSQLKEVFKKLGERIKVNALQNRFPLNVAVRVNFTGPTGVLLSPGKSSLPGDAAHFRLTSFVGGPEGGVDAWANEVGEELILAFPDCTPQWCGAWTHIKDINDRLQEIYEFGIKDFKEHLEEVDRDGMFMNSKLQEVFYPCLDEGYRSTYREERKVYLDKV